MTAVTTDHPAAVQLHAGDDIVLHILRTLHGTTACSALDATCGAKNFVALVIATEDGHPHVVIVESGLLVTRAAANTAIGRAA